MENDPKVILERVQHLPSHALTTAMRSPRGTFERRFKGARLADYAASYGLVPEPSPNGPANYYFLVTAGDGFKVALSYTEVDPESSDKQVLLAYEQDGEPIRAGVRLVVPGDDLGGRSIAGLANIELKSIRDGTPGADARPTTFELGGLVERPQRFDLKALRRFETKHVTTVPAMGHDQLHAARHYGGVSLFALLEDAGMKLDVAINEDILRKVVVARSADGYAVIIATGEIEPRFMAGDVIVATARDGQPLGDDGPLRLVVPYDKVIGRAVKNLASIELIEA